MAYSPKTTKKKDYYKCNRCKHDSLGKDMCPCPRGDCEAIIAGTVVTEIYIDTTITESQKKWNKTR